MKFRLIFTELKKEKFLRILKRRQCEFSEKTDILEFYLHLKKKDVDYLCLYAYI